jgi:hypothetical protein
MGKAWIPYDNVRVGTLAYLFCDKTLYKIYLVVFLMYEINDNNYIMIGWNSNFTNNFIKGSIGVSRHNSGGFVDICVNMS